MTVSSIYSHLVIPLISGYLLFFGLPFLRYLGQRLKGQQYFFIALLIGLFVTALGNFLLTAVRADYSDALRDGAVWAQSAHSLWTFVGSVTDIDSLLNHGGEMVSPDGPRAGFLLAVAVILLFWFISIFLSIAGIDVHSGISRYAANLDRNPIDVFIQQARFDPDKTVLLTLKNRKVYVGDISGAWLDPETTEKSIKIVPLMSGVRDEKTLKVDMNTRYDAIYQARRELLKVPSRKRRNREIEAVYDYPDGTQKVRRIKKGTAELLENEMGIVIPLREIETLSFWREDVYAFINPEFSYNDDTEGGTESAPEELESAADVRERRLRWRALRRSFARLKSRLAAGNS